MRLIDRFRGRPTAAHQAGTAGNTPRAFVIGLRYSHHAGHSGYSGFLRYVGKPVRLPFRFRWLSGRVGPALDNLAATLTRRPRVSLALLLMETVARIHMRTHRDVLYHVLHADTDLTGRSRPLSKKKSTRHLTVLLKSSRATKNRLVATFHKPPSILGSSDANRTPLQHLDGVILVAGSQRAHFEGLVPPERTHVVHHGIDTDFFHPSPVHTAEPTCITVGSYLRDFEALARSMELVWEQNPAVRLLAVGTRRYGDRQLEALCDPRIDFLDDVSDETLREAYQRAHVAIFALADATANNALLEAMACGLPIVANNVGGVQEYLVDEAWIPCPAADPRAMADGVLHVLSDRELARRMGSASRARALEHDYRVVARTLEEVYARILRMPKNEFGSPIPRRWRSRPLTDDA